MHCTMAAHRDDQNHCGSERKSIVSDEHDRGCRTFGDVGHSRIVLMQRINRLSVKPSVYQTIHIVDVVVGGEFEIDATGDNVLFITFKYFEKCLLISYLVPAD